MQLCEISKRYRLALFDFDGTLVDSEPIKFLAYQKAFQELLNFKIEDCDYIWSGKNESKVVEFFFSHYSLSNDLRDKKSNEIVKLKRELYLKYIEENKVALITNSESFLKSLKQAGLKLGLVTSSRLSEVNEIVKFYNFKQLFDLIITSDDVTNKKPAPEPYLKAIEKFPDIELNGVIAFEDSMSGYSSAKAAGIDVVLVNSELTEEACDSAVLKIENFNY